MEESIELRMHGYSVLAGGLRITLKEIVHEEIAPAPGYPAGSGSTVELSLHLGEKQTGIRLDKLSEGYRSHLEAEWEGFRITLVEVGMDSARLLVFKPG